MSNFRGSHLRSFRTHKHIPKPESQIHHPIIGHLKLAHIHAIDGWRSFCIAILRTHTARTDNHIQSFFFDPFVHLVRPWLSTEPHKSSHNTNTLTHTCTHTHWVLDPFHNTRRAISFFLCSCWNISTTTTTIIYTSSWFTYMLWWDRLDFSHL